MSRNGKRKFIYGIGNGRVWTMDYIYIIRPEPGILPVARIHPKYLDNSIIRGHGLVHKRFMYADRMLRAIL